MKRSTAIATTGGTVGAIIAIIIAILNGGTPAPPPTDTATTTVAQTQTVVASDTVTETAEPEPPAVEPAAPTSTDTVDTGGRVRPVPPAARCTVEETATAERYSHTPGYEYLLNRCDLIGKWRSDNTAGDVVVWLARHGYNSPLARCPWSFTVESTVPPENWNAIRVTRGDETRYVKFSPGQWAGNRMSFAVEFPCTAGVMRSTDKELAFGWYKEAVQDGHPYTLYGFPPVIMPVAATALPIPDLRFQP